MKCLFFFTLPTANISQASIFNIQLPPLEFEQLLLLRPSSLKAAVMALRLFSEDDPAGNCERILLQDNEGDVSTSESNVKQKIIFSNSSDLSQLINCRIFPRKGFE